MAQVLAHGACEMGLVGEAVIGDSVRPDHDTASMQVIPDDGGGSRLVWIHDVRPDDLVPAFRAATEHGGEIIKRTLDADTA